jgi:hypothetical protein
MEMVYAPVGHVAVALKNEFFQGLAN